MPILLQGPNYPPSKFTPPGYEHFNPSGVVPQLTSTFAQPNPPPGFFNPTMSVPPGISFFKREFTRKGFGSAPNSEDVVPEMKQQFRSSRMIQKYPPGFAADFKRGEKSGNSQSSPDTQKSKYVVPARRADGSNKSKSEFDNK